MCSTLILWNLRNYKKQRQGTTTRNNDKEQRQGTKTRATTRNKDIEQIQEQRIGTQISAFSKRNA